MADSLKRSVAAAACYVRDNHCGSPESAMSQNPIVEDTKRKLSELEEKIKAARSGKHDELAEDAQKDWHDMVERHAEINRRIEAQQDHSSDFLEGVRLDIDTLRHSFERWMARVESNFSKK
jgi:rubrerythrin